MVKMRLNKVAVEKLVSDKGQKSQLFTLPDSEHHAGTVVFAPESSDLKPGQRVYFGSKRETIRVQGQELLIMDDDNIFAVVE